MARLAVTLYTIIFCLFLHICRNEGRLIRNTRPRATLSARLPPELEDSYGTSIIRPSYIETGNQWKPMEGPPPPRQITKYRSKTPPPHPKYQEAAYSPAYYPHSKYPPRPYPPTNFIANQTLLVSDDSSPSKTIHKKPKYHPGSKKHYTPQPQYQVYEDAEDEEESPHYEASQNRFKYQEVIMGKPKLSSAPPPSTSSRLPSTFSSSSSRIPPPFSSPGPSSKRMPSSMGKGKHYHHLHYHDSEEEVIVDDGSSNYEISNGRRPYPRGSSSRYPYVTSRRSY